jgi:hypothetical protein
MTLEEFLLGTPVGIVLVSIFSTCVVLLAGWIGIEGLLTGLHNRREARENADR